MLVLPQPGWQSFRSGNPDERSPLRRQDADPLQLALYRLAWSELRGVPLDQVRAAFHYVRTGATVEPANLPDRAALESAIRLGH